MYFGSNTHTTQEESAESGRSDFTGTILFFHRYKITYDSLMAKKERQNSVELKLTRPCVNLEFLSRTIIFHGIVRAR